MCHTGGRPGGVVTVLPAGSQQGRGRQPLIPEVPARPMASQRPYLREVIQLGVGVGGSPGRAQGQERGLPGARALISCKLAPRATSHHGVGAGSWGCGEMLMVEQSVPRGCGSGWGHRYPHPEPLGPPTPSPAALPLAQASKCKPVARRGLQVAGAAGGRWAGSWNPQAFEPPGHSPSCPNSAVARGLQGQSWPWQQLCSCPEWPWVDPFVSAPGETPAGRPGGLGP